MDLISTDYIWRDKKVITDGVYDLAFGSDENDFKLTVTEKIKSIEGGSLLYIDGTEYGGVVDKIGYDDSKGTVSYEGRSWSGILNSKIIIPTSGYEGYAIEEGTKFNTAITTLLTAMGVLTNNTYERTTNEGDSLTYKWTFLLDVDNAVRDIPVENNYVDPNDPDAALDPENQKYKTKYIIEEFASGYDGICEFLKSLNIALTFYLRQVSINNTVISVPVLHFVPATDWTETEEFDMETLPIEGTRLLNKTNHFIGLGNKIDGLTQRIVSHIYLTATGELTTDVTEWGFPGASEIAAAEEIGIVEQSKCDREAKKRMKKLIEEDEINVTLYASHNYKIGDTVGRKEDILFDGEWIKQQITKKIVKLNNDDITVDYEIGGDKK